MNYDEKSRKTAAIEYYRDRAGLANKANKAVPKIAPKVILRMTDMTLRDVFAAQVISALFQSLPDSMPSDQAQNHAAVIAYELADAMLAARGE